ncbi:MAG: TerB family tellurite resistance protein [Candidatus Limnocylindrales bacterium]|jgi:tellurite resistance protein
MVLRGLFGGDREPSQPLADPQLAAANESQSIRRIAAEMEALPIEQRRFIAGFAYVLARAAHADLEFSSVELRFMEQAVTEVGHLSEAQAVLVVEMARNMTELYGATDDYVVTREFTNNSTREQREDLLRTAFAVGAADDSITAAESAELNQIGKELGFRADEVDAIRNEFRDQLAAIQAMRAARGA